MIFQTLENIILYLNPLWFSLKLQSILSIQIWIISRCTQTIQIFKIHVLKYRHIPICAILIRLIEWQKLILPIWPWRNGWLLPILLILIPKTDGLCFKYRPIRPRYHPISPFLSAADTIWENRSSYRLQQKRSIFEILADKSPDIGR